jgi:RNA methyltransferase, TrmH family
MVEISSTANPRIKEIHKLMNRKERAGSGLAYIEGLRIVIQAIQDGWEIQTLIYCSSLLVSQVGKQALDGFLADGQNKSIEVSDSVFRYLSGKDGPQGLAAVIKQKWSTLAEIDLRTSKTIIALDEIADPGNLGTIIRTADACGVTSVILLDNCTDPYDPSSIRASMGALFNMAMIKCTLEDFSVWKKSSGIQMYGAAGGTKNDYHNTRYVHPLVLLMGSERHGLSDRHLDICDQVVSIPMAGKSDSLNLAMAAGIILYEILNHQRESFMKMDDTK